MKLFNKLAIILAFGATISGFTACSEPDGEITSIAYDRLFRPTDFKASVNKQTAVFEWECISSADHYQVELFANDTDLVVVQDEDAVPDTIVTLKESPDSVTNLAPKTVYSARIKAISADGDKESKYAVIEKTFKTKDVDSPAPEPSQEQTAHLDFADKAVEASYTIGCLTMNINNGNSKFAIDANTQYFGTADDYTKYTSRLKTGGNSSSSNGVTFVSTGTGTITIAMRSSSSSADRTVTFTKDGEEAAKFTVGDGNSTANVTIPGEDAAKTVFNTYSFAITPGTYEVSYDGGVNFYAIDVTYVGDDTPATEPEDGKGVAGTLDFGETAVGVADGTVYNFGSASLTVNNGNSKFAIDLNTQYFGDATTQTKYVTRLKTGGASASTNGATLTLAAKGTVTIAMRSSSSSADRAVTINDATGVAVATFTVSDTNSTANVTIPGEDAAKTVFSYYTVTLEAGTYTFTYDGGVNFYSLVYEP